MSRISATIITLVTMIFAAAVSAADIPQMINYQGRLTGASGSALDTTVSMTFTIYDDSTGGSPKWSETHSAVVVTKGLFNVLLGGVIPVADSVFDNAPRYLGITISTNPEISPRTQLISVPYAYRARRADTAAVSLSGPAGQDGWTDDGNSVRLTSGSDNVGIGTSSPTEKLDVTGNIAASGMITSGGSLSIDGANDKITASGGEVDFDDDNIVTTGYVGIGEYPSLATETRLEIKGTSDAATSLIGIYHETSAPWHLAYPVLEVYNDTYGYTPFTLTGGGVIIQRTSSGSKGREAGVVVNRIDPEITYFNGGNVGFGTETPEARIDIRGAGEPHMPLVRIAQEAGAPEEMKNPMLEIRNETYGFEPLSIDGGGTITMRRSNAATYTVIGTDSSYFMGGNVGIGTEDPQRPLHVTEVMRLEPSPVPPPDPMPGDMYIDASDGNRLKVFDGAVWQACWQTGG